MRISIRVQTIVSAMPWLINENIIFSSNFVNNHGYNHEMLTVKKCWGIITQGQPESEYRLDTIFFTADPNSYPTKPKRSFSWFPGYTWQIINCAECWSHLGMVHFMVALVRHLSPSHILNQSKAGNFEQQNQH